MTKMHTRFWRALPLHVRRVSASRAVAAVSAPWRRLTDGEAHIVSRLWLVEIALIILTVAGVGLTIADMYRRTIDTNRGNMATLGAVLADQTSRTMQVLDLLLQDVQARSQGMAIRTPEEFRARLSEADTHEYLRARLLNLPQAHSITLVADDGSLVNSSRVADLGSYKVTSRDYYRHFLQQNDPQVFVSGPAVGFATGAWTMFLARRIDAPDGTFLGLVVVSIDMQYLLDFYQTISRQDLLSVTLLHRDGTVLARYPHSNGYLGKPMPAGSSWYGTVARNGGTYRSPGYLSGLASIVAVTPLPDYPLVVDVSISESQALATWWRQAIFASGVESIVVIAFVALFGMIARAARRQAAQHADLQRVTHALRQSEARLRDFARTASDWFWEQDAELRFTSVGEGSPLQNFGDRSFFGKRRWERVDTSQAPDVWEKHIRDVTEHRPFSDFRYGRIGADGMLHHISVSGVPVHDEAGEFLGYRGTGRDITDQVEAGLQLLAAKDRAEQAETTLQDAIDSMLEGFVIFDQDDRLVLCNDAYRIRYAQYSYRVSGGARYADILRYGLELGFYPDAIGREDVWFAEWMQQHREGRMAREVPLSDGRWVLVTEGRMRNGSVAGLRIDITGLKKAEATSRGSAALLDRVREIARIGG